MTNRAVLSSMYSDATYASLSTKEARPEDANSRSGLAARGFSITQVRTFFSNSEFVHHRPNDSSGFSASLVLSAEDTGGTYTLAIRGTDEVVKDALNADVGGLFLRAAAFNQIVDLYNYWKRLSAPNKADVDQVRTAPMLWSRRIPLAPLVPDHLVLSGML